MREFEFDVALNRRDYTPGNNRLTKVDADGVPRLVQRIKYKRSMMWFEYELFNGDCGIMTTDQIIDMGGPRVGLLASTISAEAMADVYGVITMFVNTVVLYGPEEEVRALLGNDIPTLTELYNPP